MRRVDGDDLTGLVAIGTALGAARRSVLGTAISNVQLDDVLNAIAHPPARQAQVITFCNVHSVMSARRQSALADALNKSDIAAPDGMPIAWWMRLVYRVPQPRVDGPSTMEEVLRAGVAHRWRHFLYGTTPATLQQLSDRLTQAHPGIEIVGTYAPPFRPLTPSEAEEVVRRIRSAKPTVVWIGLGMPKQELWMQEMRTRLPSVTLMGVGAAFDMLAGRTPRAPEWMRKSGLEWLHRLTSEPRRLWRRYIIDNPAYVLLLTRELLHKALLAALNVLPFKM